MSKLNWPEYQQQPPMPGAGATRTWGTMAPLGNELGWAQSLLSSMQFDPSFVMGLGMNPVGMAGVEQEWLNALINRKGSNLFRGVPFRGAEEVFRAGKMSPTTRYLEQSQANLGFPQGHPAPFWEYGAVSMSRNPTAASEFGDVIFVIDKSKLPSSTVDYVPVTEKGWFNKSGRAYLSEEELRNQAVPLSSIKEILVKGGVKSESIDAIAEHAKRLGLPMRFVSAAEIAQYNVRQGHR